MTGVTDQQVAVLREQLRGNFEEHERLRAEMSEESARTGYIDLLNAAFAEAVKRRFTGKGRSDVIDWVSETRASRDTAGRIDPQVAEQLILTIFKQGSIQDIEVGKRIGHQMLITYLLIQEEDLDDAGIDQFLAGARKLGNELGR